MDDGARRMDRIGSHLSAGAGWGGAGGRAATPRSSSARDDDVVVVDAIRTPITRAKKV